MKKVKEVYPKVDLKTWCETWGLNPEEGKCPECGIKITPSIPWMAGEWRGLVSKEHGCNVDGVPCVAISIDPEFNKMVEDLFEELKK